MRTNSISDQSQTDALITGPAPQEKPTTLSILLLGQAGAGKSTILKQMRMLYNREAHDRERLGWRLIIFLNLINSVKAILDIIEQDEAERRAELALDSPSLHQAGARTPTALSSSEASFGRFSLVMQALGTSRFPPPISTQSASLAVPSAAGPRPPPSPISSASPSSLNNSKVLRLRLAPLFTLQRELRDELGAVGDEEDALRTLVLKAGWNGRLSSSSVSSLAGSPRDISMTIKPVSVPAPPLSAFMNNTSLPSSFEGTGFGPTWGPRPRTASIASEVAVSFNPPPAPTQTARVPRPRHGSRSALAGSRSIPALLSKAVVSASAPFHIRGSGGGGGGGGSVVAGSTTFGASDARVVKRLSVESGDMNTMTDSEADLVDDDDDGEEPDGFSASVSPPFLPNHLGQSQTGKEKSLRRAWNKRRLQAQHSISTIMGRSSGTGSAAAATTSMALPLTTPPHSALVYSVARRVSVVTAQVRVHTQQVQVISHATAAAAAGRADAPTGGSVVESHVQVEKHRPWMHHRGSSASFDESHLPTLSTAASLGRPFVDGDPRLYNHKNNGTLAAPAHGEVTGLRPQRSAPSVKSLNTGTVNDEGRQGGTGSAGIISHGYSYSSAHPTARQDGEQETLRDVYMSEDPDSFHALTRVRSAGSERSTWSVMSSPLLHHHASWVAATRRRAGGGGLTRPVLTTTTTMTCGPGSGGGGGGGGGEVAAGQSLASRSRSWTSAGVSVGSAQGYGQTVVPPHAMMGIAKTTTTTTSSSSASSLDAVVASTMGTAYDGPYAQHHLDSSSHLGAGVRTDGCSTAPTFGPPAMPLRSRRESETAGMVSPPPPFARLGEIAEANANGGGGGVGGARRDSSQSDRSSLLTRVHSGPCSGSVLGSGSGSGSSGHGRSEMSSMTSRAASDEVPVPPSPSKATLHETSAAAAPAPPDSGDTVGYRRNHAASMDDPAVLLAACKEEIRALWNDAAVVAYRKHSSLPGEVDVEYLMDHLDRIASADYVPTDEDILRARVRTLGAVEETFRISASLSARLIDVGGSIHQRKAWTPFFDNKTDAFIFVASVGGYDEMLAEDAGKNRVEDSLALFKGIMESKLLRRASVILLLNKVDVLATKLGRAAAAAAVAATTTATHVDGGGMEDERSPLDVRTHFPGYDGPLEVEPVLDYFRTAFLAIAEAAPYPASECDVTPTRPVFVHAVVAVDAGGGPMGMGRVLRDVMEVVLEGHVADIAML